MVVWFQISSREVFGLLLRGFMCLLRKYLDPSGWYWENIVVMYVYIYIYTHSMSSIFDMIYTHKYIYMCVCHHFSLPFHHFIRFLACFGIAPGVSLAYSNKPSDMRSKLLPMVRPLEMFPEWALCLYKWYR